MTDQQAIALGLRICTYVHYLKRSIMIPHHHDLQDQGISLSHPQGTGHHRGALLDCAYESQLSADLPYCKMRIRVCTHLPPKAQLAKYHPATSCAPQICGLEAIPHHVL